MVADEYLDWYIEGVNIKGEKFTVRPHGPAYIIYNDTTLTVKVKLKKSIPNAHSVTAVLRIDGKSPTQFGISAGEALKYQTDINEREYSSIAFRFSDFGINSGWHSVGLGLTYKDREGRYHDLGETIWSIHFDVRGRPAPPEPKPPTPPKVYVTVEFKPDKPIKITDKGATIYAYEGEYIPFRIKVIDITPKNCDVKLALYTWGGSRVWTAWASELLGKEVIVKRPAYEGYFTLGTDFSAGYKGCWLGGVKVTPYSKYYVAIIGKKPTVKIIKLDIEPTEVNVGEEVKATAVLYGTPKSSWKVELYVNDNKVADKDVTLSAYGDAYVMFTLKFKEAGEYNIRVCCTDEQ